MKQRQGMCKSSSCSSLVMASKEGKDFWNFCHACSRDAKSLQMHYCYCYFNVLHPMTTFYKFIVFSTPDPVLNSIYKHLESMSSKGLRDCSQSFLSWDLNLLFYLLKLKFYRCDSCFQLLSLVLIYQTLIILLLSLMWKGFFFKTRQKAEKTTPINKTKKENVPTVRGGGIP